MNRKRNDRDVDIRRNGSSSSTSSTSNSSREAVFKAQTPFVLELHDIRKDELPTDPTAPIGPAEGKIKKHRKKKKQPPAKNASSDSLSDESSIAPSATDVKEEFYDAHESYHAIPENTLIAATTLAIAENGPASKVEATLLPPSAEPPSTDPAAPAPTTTIVKPTSPP